MTNSKNQYIKKAKVQNQLPKKLEMITTQLEKTDSLYKLNLPSEYAKEIITKLNKIEILIIDDLLQMPESRLKEILSNYCLKEATEEQIKEIYFHIKNTLNQNGMEFKTYNQLRTYNHPKRKSKTKTNKFHSRKH